MRLLAFISFLLLTVPTMAQTDSVIADWTFQNTLVSTNGYYTATVHNGATLTANGVTHTLGDSIKFGNVTSRMNGAERNTGYSGSIAIRLTPSINHYRTTVGLLDKLLLINTSSFPNVHYADYNLTTTFYSGINGQLYQSQGPYNSQRAFDSGVSNTLIITWNSMFYRMFVNGKFYGSASLTRYDNEGADSTMFPGKITNLVFGVYRGDDSHTGINNSGFTGKLERLTVYNYQFDEAQAYAYHNATTAKVTAENAFIPQRGKIILTKGGAGFDEESVQEAWVAVTKNISTGIEDTCTMIYTARNNATAHTAGAAWTNDPEGTWTKTGQVIGAANPAANTNSSHGAGVQDSANARTGYYFTSADGDSHTFLRFRLTNIGRNMVVTYQDTAFISDSLIGAGTGSFGNITIAPEKDKGGFWNALIEYSISPSTGVWRVGHIRTRDLEGAWEFTGKCHEAPYVIGSSVTAPCLKYVNGYYVIWYGYQGDEQPQYTRALPDIGAFAYSDHVDIKKWKGKQVSHRLWHKGFGYYTDQNQDPEVFEFQGSTYRITSLLKNQAPFEASLIISSNSNDLSTLAHKITGK